MQRTFSDFTNTQGYIKIGRCTSTGDCIFLPETSDGTPEAITQSTVSETCFEYLHFDPLLMFNELLSDEELQNMLFKLPECYGLFPKEHSPEICFLTELLFTKFHEQKAHYEDSMRGILLSLLSLITRSLTATNKIGKADSHIQAALLFIHNNYADKLSVADIAKHCCNMSASHFRRKFNEILHISPLDYINTLRIHKACQLIYHSEMHINEIARAVGFTTLSSFNRQFQAFLDTSPTEWRKKHDSPISQIYYTAYKAN